MFIPTYNSALHLRECIRSARMAYPTSRVVLVDHHSTDPTLAIAEDEGCEVVAEERGLGYARQLSMELSRTEVFAMVESDLVFHEFGWYNRALGLLRGRVGAVVAYVPRSGRDARGRYAEFWTRFTPLRERRHGFSAGATLFRREAVAGIKIPVQLHAYEDLFMAREMRTRGWSHSWLEVAGVHYSDYEDAGKARWYGANARAYASISGDRRLLRRNALLPLMGGVAAIGTLRPSVLLWSLSFSLNFFRGWRDPARFSVMKR